jgi:hypothetical protein
LELSSLYYNFIKSLPFKATTYFRYMNLQRYQQVTNMRSNTDMRFTAFSQKAIKTYNGRCVSSQIYLKKRTGMAPELMGMKEACVCVFICIITAAHDRPLHQQAATRIVKKKATLFIVILAQNRNRFSGHSGFCLPSFCGL